MLSNVVSAYYKAFGQTFIRDDQFLSMVGAITSVFNCSGRVLYGLVMDRWAYKVSMSLEAVLLILLMSTFYLTSLIGVPEDMEPVSSVCRAGLQPDLRHHRHLHQPPLRARGAAHLPHHQAGVRCLGVGHLPHLPRWE